MQKILSFKVCWFCTSFVSLLSNVDKMSQYFDRMVFFFFSVQYTQRAFARELLKIIFLQCLFLCRHDNETKTYVMSVNISFK